MISLEKFEILMLSFQDTVSTYGAKSDEVSLAIDEIVTSCCGNMTTEHAEIMKRLGILPKPTLSPVSLALAEYNQIVAVNGEDSPEAKVAFFKILEVAPDEYLDAACEVVNEMFDMPKPIGVSDDGNSLYALNDIAIELGISADDAAKKMLELEDMTGKKLHHEGQVHTIH